MNPGLPVRTDAAVPLLELVAQQADVNADLMGRLAEVFRQAAVIDGPAVAEFETADAEFLDARQCVGMANGTDTLELTLRAPVVGAGDEVILPANTIVGTAEPASRVGAVPVPIDVDPEYLLIDPEAAATAVTPRTRAIMPVHLFGQKAFVERLIPVASACGAVIVEDPIRSQCATRFGRSAGTSGLAAGTRFYPGKNLRTAGDAGAVVTDDGGLADRVRKLGLHGSSHKYVHTAVGFNSSLNAVGTAVLRAKLPKPETWNLMRRAAAERHSHLLAALQSAEIQTGVHYPVPVHLSGASVDPEVCEGSSPVTERAAGRILSLPLYPRIKEAQRERVARAVSTAMSQR